MPDYIEYDQVKPNDKSLVIELDKRIKGDGDISDQGISVYIMKYTREVKKKFKEYGNCALSDINSVEAKQAYYYGGLYFFNDVPPGKYLIKVCALYGNWIVINREKETEQKIKMQVSPPIQ